MSHKRDVLLFTEMVQHTILWDGTFLIGRRSIHAVLLGLRRFLFGIVGLLRDGPLLTG